MSIETYWEAHPYPPELPDRVIMSPRGRTAPQNTPGVAGPAARRRTHGDRGARGQRGDLMLLPDRFNRRCESLIVMQQIRKTISIGRAGVAIDEKQIRSERARAVRTRHGR
jgi:hypothetical protein